MHFHAILIHSLPPSLLSLFLSLSRPLSLSLALNENATSTHEYFLPDLWLFRVRCVRVFQKQWLCIRSESGNLPLMARSAHGRFFDDAVFSCATEPRQKNPSHIIGMVFRRIFGGSSNSEPQRHRQLFSFLSLRSFFQDFAFFSHSDNYFCVALQRLFQSLLRTRAVLFDLSLVVLFLS